MDSEKEGDKILSHTVKAISHRNFESNDRLPGVDKKFQDNQ